MRFSIVDIAQRFKLTRHRGIPNNTEKFRTSSKGYRIHIYVSSYHSSVSARSSDYGSKIHYVRISRTACLSRLGCAQLKLLHKGKICVSFIPYPSTSHKCIFCRRALLTSSICLCSSPRPPSSLELLIKSSCVSTASTSLASRSPLGGVPVLPLGLL